MSTADLGPLERALLQTLAALDSLGLGGVPTEALWRLCPYGTGLANVQAALQSGPLSRAVVMENAQVALGDRADALADPAGRRGRLQTQLEQLQGPLTGLSKLPWVEGIAVAGPAALGQLTPGQLVDVVLLAEGGRAEAAAWATSRWLATSATVRMAVRMVGVVDADELPQAPGDLVAAILWSTLRPVTNSQGWARFAEANPWLADRLPNGAAERWPDLVFPEAGGRVDGRLAQLRRRIVAPEEGLLTSETRRGRRRGLVEQILGDRLIPAPHPRTWLASKTTAFEARWEQVEAWEPDAGGPAKTSAPDPSAEAFGAGEAPTSAPSGPDAEAPASAPEAAPPANPLPRSTRRRGPTRRPLRGGASATGETGIRRRKRAPAGGSRRQ